MQRLSGLLSSGSNGQTLYMRPFSNLEEAFSTALAEKGDHAGVYAMTVGGTTLPEYREDHHGK